MEKVIQFFNLALPCPAEIPNCEQLREEFQKEVNETMRRGGGCYSCVERRIRNAWTTRIQALFNT